MYNTQEDTGSWLGLEDDHSGFLYKKIFYSYSINWDLLATIGSPTVTRQSSDNQVTVTE